MGFFFKKHSLIHFHLLLDLIILENASKSVLDASFYFFFSFGNKLTLYKVAGNYFPPPIFEIHTRNFLLCFSSFHLINFDFDFEQVCGSGEPGALPRITLLRDSVGNNWNGQMVDVLLQESYICSRNRNRLESGT